MDINVRMSNLTPEELAVLIPALQQVQELHDKRILEREERLAKQFAAAKAYEITNQVEEPDLPPVEEPKPVEQEELPLQEVPVTTPEPVKTEPVADLETVRGLLNRVKNEKGADVVRALLEKFGVKRVPDLPEEKYGELLEAATEV